MKSDEPRQWYGIRTNVTDVLSDFGMPYTQIGTDMRVTGELQRRPGFQSTSIAQQAGPIRYIISAFPPGRPFLTFDIGGAGAGTIIGEEDAPPPPQQPKRRKPVVVAGQPQAPVITGVTPSPTSPPATYIIGAVTFTAAVTYDGLSGPLVYEWTQPDSGFAQAAVIVDNANPASFDFDALCFPGAYNYSLTVYPLLRPDLFTTSPETYTVL